MVSVSTIGVVTVLTCGLCFYHWVVNVLTVWSLFLPLGCNCSYGVVSVYTVGLVTVLTVWSLFISLGW